jgi:glycosyltransferase involved in cell wall biosynthesis
VRAQAEEPDGAAPADLVPGLSIVLPAFNEEANVGPMIEAALATLPALADRYEVIVVDDGSSDATVARAEDWVRRRHPAVRLLAHDRNRGYGAAIRTGLRLAREDLVFYTDSDRQFDIAQLSGFLPLARDHELVIGFRRHRHDPLMRSVFSGVFNGIVRVLFAVKARDVNCAFKLMRRSALEELELQSDDFFIDTEILAAARRANFRIAQLPVDHYPRQAGESTIQAGNVPQTLRSIVHMWRRTHRPSDRTRARVAARDEEANIREVLPGPAPAAPPRAASR